MGAYSRLLLLTASVAGHWLAAADWPQWRHDRTRSGATAEALPSTLALQWMLPLGKPAPAYTHQYRMCADYSYAPVAADGLLFVPSNVTDQVMAFDLATGGMRWRYVTDGPVRFAPVYDSGRLYFCSDDGHLYCVAAVTGELLWRRRGVPEGIPDMLMLVNGRMVSRWPARGGPVLSHGKVFFGAGIWPEEGSYVTAVSAESGDLLWRSDALSIVKEGMCDHGTNLDLSLPPQGYMAVINDRLVVASGRTLAAWFELDTGKMDPYTSFYVKKSNPRGTWYVAGNDDFWVQGGNWFGARSDVVPARPENTICPLAWSRKSPANAEFQLRHRPFLVADVNQTMGGEVTYSEPVLTGDTSYAAAFATERKHLVLNGETVVRFRPFERIVARDLTKPAWRVIKSRVDMGRTAGKGVSLIEFPVKWEIETSMRVLIKTADHLVVGESGKLAAIAIPGEGQSPTVGWEAAIDGNPINTLLAHGKLVTVTDTGKVYCFGAGPERQVGIPHSETVEHSPRNGYAFLLGVGDGKALLELAKDPEWRVVAVERDPLQLKKSRAMLNDLALCGRRAQIIPARDGMQLTPYWASRVIVNDATVLGTPTETLSVAVNALRPYGGQMPSTPGVDRQLLAGILAGRTDYELRADTLIRLSAPEGAADWAQEAGGGDNSFVGRDSLVKWPLGVLWYSGDIDRFLPPFTDLTHIRSPYPLVGNGRLYMFTHETLHAIDIYTGNYLWHRDIPATPYVNTRRFLNRLYGKPTERSYLLADDSVYCVTGKKIHVYDAVTGEPRNALIIPEELGVAAAEAASLRMNKKMRDYEDRYDVQPVPEWTEARLWGDSIVAKLGNTLVAVDRHSSRLLWARSGKPGNTTVCTVGRDTLYGLDCTPDEYTRKEEQSARTGELFALDLRDGSELWRRTVSYLSWPKGVSKGIVPWMKKAAPALGYNAKHGLLVMTYNGMSATVFEAADGSELWSKQVDNVKEPAWNYTPNILDDHLMMSLSKHQGGMGYLLDIRTGESLKAVNVPRARTCGRMIGNDHLLSYRDGATELYDVDRDLTIPLNSLRTGCTTSFIPACGIMTAPMMGHGCVCNYPMFASLAMVHMPESDSFRPKAVRQSWGADQKVLRQSGE